ncbi:MAG TPA: hypothetical protein VN764_10320 [Polyangiaceae bacterium]|nr:hypothetical protein [Polyangiaceae bacterium]
MFWVGLATLIMLISGTGDDSREFRKRMQAMHEATEHFIGDGERRARADRALQETSAAFLAHRTRLDKLSRCIGDADADYHATQAQYAACLDHLDEMWAASVNDFLRAEQHFRAAASQAELLQIHHKVLKR